MKKCLFWTIGFLRAGYDGSEGHLGTSLGGYLRVDSEVHLGSILVNSEVNLGPSLGNLIEYIELAFIWPWVGPFSLRYTKYGS